MKHLVFFHRADLDGWCSRKILERYFKKQGETDVKYVGADYHDDPKPYLEMVKDAETTWVVDYTLPVASKDPAKRLDSMIYANQVSELVWFDHHTIIFDALDAGFNPDGLRRDDVAACELVWEGLFDEPHPLAVTLLGMYDSWRYVGTEDERDVLAFQYGMNRHDYRCDDGLWLSLLDDSRSAVPKIANDGMIILDHVENQDRRSMPYTFETEFESYSCLAINRQPANSRMFSTKPGYTIYIAFALMPSMVWKVSLYSTDVDVSKIAKSYGGGGHVGAAGFDCTELPFYPHLKTTSKQCCGSRCHSNESEVLHGKEA